MRFYFKEEDEPKMIAADETLQARTELSISEVVAQLYGLIDWSVAITEVRALRSTEVNSEAFGRTGGRKA